MWGCLGFTLLIVLVSVLTMGLVDKGPGGVTCMVSTLVQGRAVIISVSFCDCGGGAGFSSTEVLNLSKSSDSSIDCHIP